MSADVTQTVTVLIYSALWSADNAGYKRISDVMDRKNEVLDMLVELGISSSRINLLLANKGGLEFDSITAPAEDGVYLSLD